MSAIGQVLIRGRENSPGMIFIWDEYENTVTIEISDGRICASYELARELRSALDFLFADRYRRD